MDHVGLLLGISELNEMLHETTTLSAFLDRCVEIIAHHLDAEVCSVYMFDPANNRLNLGSTYGLNKQSIPSVSLGLGEGLTGLAMQKLEPIMVRESSKHPNYRHFPGLNEESFDAYLGVPIVRGIVRIGVLVVQRSTTHPFDKEDQKSLRGVTNQIAAMIDYVRLLLDSGSKSAASGNQVAPCPSFIKGRAASGGWAIGPAIIDSQIKDFSSVPGRPEDQLLTAHDFEIAIEKTFYQLTLYQQQIEERLTDVASLIFAAHILLLKDGQFMGKMRQQIAQGTDPISALVSVATEYMALFAKMENPYFRQKSDDIRDVSLRLLKNLVSRETSRESVQGCIVVAADLVPSDILILSVEKAAGIIFVGGGVTSHVAILARSLKLPTVVAADPGLFTLTHSEPVLMDAETGNIYVDPAPAILAPYEQRKKRQSQLSEVTEVLAEPKTRDGTRVAVYANVNLISDVGDARQMQAAGIGLYRTEFPFIIRNSFPSEEEQFVVYRKLVDGMPGKPVTFRTLDIGGDKILSYYDTIKERNPFLGMRSMRFCLQNREVFKQQIRAILRAGASADLAIMFPMISSTDELDEALSVVATCKNELALEKAEFNEKPRLGMMVELPSVIAILDDLAKRVDFFSVGTNDLIQYILGVDRTNEKVAQFYCAHHPSVLRAIHSVAEAAARAGIAVSVCGDMAHEEKFVEFFLGIGIRSLSIDPLYFPAVCKAIAKIDVSEAERKARFLLACPSIKGTEQILFPPEGITNN